MSISGGLDSTCLLMTLLAKDYEVKAYSLKYGQKHVIELEKVQKNIKFLQDKGFPINHQVIDLTSAFNESVSSLSSFSGAEIPEGSYMEEKMKSIMGTRVQIHRKKNDKGKIEIEYYSKDELERIIDLFESIG